jgi:hypothetical protein
MLVNPPGPGCWVTQHEGAPEGAEDGNKGEGHQQHGFRLLLTVACGNTPKVTRKVVLPADFPITPIYEALRGLAPEQTVAEGRVLHPVPLHQRPPR